MAGRLRGVAGEHLDGNPLATKAGDHSGRLGARRITDGKETGQLSLDRDGDDRRPRLAGPLERRGRHGHTGKRHSRVDATLDEKPLAAEERRASGNPATDPAPHDGPDVAGRGERQTGRGFGEGPGEGMLAAGLEARRVKEELVEGRMGRGIASGSASERFRRVGLFDAPFGDGDRGGDPRLAEGQRAGLVEDDGPYPCQTLHRVSRADEDPGRGAAADRHRHRQRRGEAKRTRAGDHEHAHRREQTEGEARLRPEHRPAGEGKEGDEEDDRHKRRRDPIGELLDRRPLGMGIADEPGDPGHEGVVRVGDRLDDEDGRAVDRTAEDAVAGAAGHR